MKLNKEKTDEIMMTVQEAFLELSFPVAFNLLSPLQLSLQTDTTVVVTTTITMRTFSASLMNNALSEPSIMDITTVSICRRMKTMIPTTTRSLPLIL